MTHLLNEELGWPMLWLLLYNQEIQPKKYDPRLEVSVVQHSSKGFLLGLWNLEGRNKETFLKMCNLRRPELFNSYTHLPQPQNMKQEKNTKLEDVPSCSKRWRSVGANLSDIFLALLKSDDGASLRNNTYVKNFAGAESKHPIDEKRAAHLS